MSRSPRVKLPIAAPSLPETIATGLHKLGLAMKQQAWHQASDEGLSPTQGQILAALVSHGAMTNTELALRLGVTLPTISESVRVLDEKRLVTRAPDPRHPRARLIEPTVRGKAQGARARSWPEFMASAIGDLTDDEQRAFFAGVVKMIRGLQEQGLVPLEGMCLSCTHFRAHVRRGASPHHCALIDAPLAASQLKLDCPDHVVAEPEARATVWAQFQQQPLRPG